MEPSAVENSKWGLRLQRYSEIITTGNEQHVTHILQEIERKIDKIADAIFGSTNLSTQFKNLINITAKKYYVPPQMISNLCLSILDLLNTRVPGFINIPACLQVHHPLQTEDDICNHSLFQLNNLLKKEPFVQSLLEDFELLFWKCLATLKRPEHKKIFHQCIDQILRSIDAYLIRPEKELFPQIENILEFIISHTDHSVRFESLFYFMQSKPNQIFWTYILKKMDYIGQPVSFKRLKLDVSPIISIVNSNPECCQNFKKYLNSCFLVFQNKENQRDFREQFVQFFDFYSLLIRLSPGLSNPVIAKSCTETTEVRLKNGPVNIFLFQHELLQNIEGFNENKLLAIPRRKFRLMIKHFYQLSWKVSDLPIDDVVTLAELAKFLNHKEMQKQTTEKINAFIDSLPKNGWQLYEDDSFNSMISLTLSLANLNLHEHLKKCRKCLWPPRPQVGSPLIRILLKNTQNTSQFSNYMRQLGYLCWLNANYFPNVTENKKNTLLQLANSFVSWFLIEIFELLEDENYAAQVPILLKILQTNLLQPYQIPVKLKAINPPIELIKEESLIELDLTNCNLWNINDLRALEGLPLGNIIISKTMSRHIDQIKHVSPGLKITYN